ncbi:MAG: hypothetical protein OEY63_06870 [Gemmatimonadota bacterium]|nr:hypothetical protein [Gemmatimonadota bacterium]
MTEKRTWGQQPAANTGTVTRSITGTLLLGNRPEIRGVVVFDMLMFASMTPLD